MSVATVIVAAAPAVELAELETVSAQLAAAVAVVDELRARRNRLIVESVERRRHQLVTTARYAGVSPQQCLRVIEGHHRR